jgi:hypothetical protein
MQVHLQAWNQYRGLQTIQMTEIPQRLNKKDNVRAT